MNNTKQYLQSLALSATPSFSSLGYDFAASDSAIHHICDDSRDIKTGDTYLCLPRAKDQSQTYIHAAEQAGAKHIIHIGHSSISTKLPCLNLPDMEAAGLFLRRFFHTEKTTTQCIGITGTDGKTSVTWMLREALERQYGKAWSCGTLGWIQDQHTSLDLGNTTPSLLLLHQLLGAANKQAIPALIMEVSSHGIEQNRIAGIDFNAAVWTTLGHDHLQDHGGFDAYAKLKSSFIEHTAKQAGHVIYNHDQQAILQNINTQYPTTHAYGHGLYQHSPDIDFMAWEQELPGLLRLACQQKEVVIENIPNSIFHAENITAVAQVLHSHYELSLEDMIPLLSNMTAPPGRMQAVDSAVWQVFIDYAHTPEALQSCLQSARLTTQGRILLVFGCGGERDREKRPEMGRIASGYADVIWITSDNPRNEKPEVIASEIEGGIPHPYPLKVHLELNRQQAIAEAIIDLQPEDCLIIAGKGHENYIETLGQRSSWSDMNCAYSELQKKSCEAISCN